MAARFSKDGAYLLTSGKDRTFRLWNPRKGTCIKTYAGHAREVRDLDAASDNSRIASCGGDKDVFVWDVTSGSKVRRFKGHDGGVNAVKFCARDDSVVVTAGFDRTVRFFDCRSNNSNALQVISGAFHDAVMSVAVPGKNAADRNRILAGSVDGTAKLFDVRVGACFTDDFGSEKAVTSVSFSGDGGCALVGALGNRLCALDTEDGSVLAEYKGRVSRTQKIDSRFTHDDAFVVSGGEDGAVTIWDLVDAKLVETVDAHPGKHSANTLDWHPTQPVMATGGSDGVVRVWVPPGTTEKYEVS